MLLTDNHSFHNCPLRSSSLLVVNKDKQTIVTATDEVFDTLGYDPTQLVGQSINLLNPRISKDKEHFIMRHASLGKLPFDICIHHDPLTNAEDLDYWLIRPHLPITRVEESLIPKVHQYHSTSPISILRLSTFGTIEHAYPSKEFPQKTKSLKGHPIMSFVHESDVRNLCEQIRKARHRTHHTFRVQWMQGDLRSEEGSTYQWVTITVMNVPSKLSCNQMEDTQTRPICIIRPIDETTSTITAVSLVSNIMSSTLTYCMQQMNIYQLCDIMELLNTAIDQGRSYVVEYLTHIVTYMVDMACEIMYNDIPMTDAKAANRNRHNTKYRKNKSAKHKSNKNKKTDKGCFMMETPTIKVSVRGEGIWTVPLINTHKTYGMRWIQSLKNQTTNQLSANINNIHAYWVSKKSD
ncbi:hypothetical protein BDB01DRAFT_773097 [Pilobolus umbonatus]|nr:hypothetical protein BDB01DRAFT_773097 [Pilobolus umbonatus]